MATANQPTSTPTNKVTAGLLAGAIVTILVFLVSLTGVAIPAVVSGALTVIVSFVTSYFVKESV